MIINAGSDFSCVLYVVMTGLLKTMIQYLNIECFDWIKLYFPCYWFCQELEKLKQENKELYEELMELRRQIQVKISHTTRLNIVNYFTACLTTLNVICTIL